MSHQSEQTERGFSMMKPAGQKVFAWARVARVIVAMSGLLAFAACQDAVAPEKPKDPALTPMFGQNAQTPLQMLGTTLPYSTDMFVASVTDPAVKSKIRSFLTTLRNDLASNKTSAVKNDVAVARAAIAAAPVDYTADLAAVSVALDQIDLALASK